MTVQTIPAGCGVGPIANPPPHPHWNDPAAITASAAVYACDRGAIAPGVTETITFAVVKAAGAATDEIDGNRGNLSSPQHQQAVTSK